MLKIFGMEFEQTDELNICQDNFISKSQSASKNKQSFSSHDSLILID